MNTVVVCNSLRSKEPLHINGEMSQSIRQGRINGRPKDSNCDIINIQRDPINYTYDNELFFVTSYLRVYHSIFLNYLKVEN